MSTTTEHRHLDDGTLQQLVDGESLTERAAVDAQLATCAACRDRLATRRTGSDALSALLAATRPAPLDDLAVARLRRNVEARLARTPRTPWWTRAATRTAAAGVVLVAGMAMASPVRSWVAARLGRAPADVPVAPHASPPSAPGVAAHALVSFETDAPELVIQVATAQREGALVIRGDTAHRSTASVLGGDETLVVLPSTLRIRNAPASRSDYVVSTSVNVRHVRLRIGDDATGERVIVVRPGSLARVPLGQGPSVPDDRR